MLYIDEATGGARYDEYVAKSGSYYTPEELSNSSI